MAEIPDYMINKRKTNDIHNTTTSDSIFCSTIIIIASSVLSGIGIFIICLVILFCKYQPHKILKNRIQNNIYNKGVFLNNFIFLFIFSNKLKKKSCRC